MATGGKHAEQNFDSSRKAVRDLLIEKVRADRYPSAAMMYLAESQLTDRCCPTTSTCCSTRSPATGTRAWGLIRRFMALTGHQPTRRVPGAVVGGRGIREPTRT